MISIDDKQFEEYTALRPVLRRLLYDKYFQSEMFIEDNRTSLKDITAEELMYVARQYINYHKMTGDFPLYGSFDHATALILDEVLTKFLCKDKCKEQG